MRASSNRSVASNNLFNVKANPAKNNIFFDALTHSLRRFQLYVACLAVQTNADIENCERLALIEKKRLPNE